jgi:hypothetical protein
MAQVRQTAQGIFNKYSQDKTILTKSLNWFQREAAKLRTARIQPQSLLRPDSKNRTSSVMVPGNLYMYFYDAKLKEQLPYYDMFPLVFPFSTTDKGFTGLNMHYLPYQLRVRLLDRLLEYANNKKYDETTRIRYSWATIRSASKFVLAKPCVHSYLYDHIQSTMLRVSPENWFTVMMLPVERFTVNKSNVWADSIGKI